MTRSADSEYPYRQSSDFWYFTGFNEPEAVLVLIKSNDTHNHSVILTAYAISLPKSGLAAA